MQLQEHTTVVFWAYIKKPIPLWLNKSVTLSVNKVVLERGGAEARLQ